MVDALPLKLMFHIQPQGVISNHENEHPIFSSEHVHAYMHERDLQELSLHSQLFKCLIQLTQRRIGNATCSPTDNIP